MSTGRSRQDGPTRRRSATPATRRNSLRRQFVIHTDEGDIPVEWTFDPTPRPIGEAAPRRRVPSRGRGRG